MAITPKRLADNLRRVRDNVASAAARVQRDPAGVALVAVTKSADAEDVRNLIELGVTDLAESRVQHLLERAGDIAQWLSRRRKEAPPIRWHMVGHLQRNKVRPVLDWAGVIHSVDTLRLGEEIDARAAAAGKPIDVLVEVNCSREPQKMGVVVGAASHLAEQISTLRHLRLVGLMTMAPRVTDPQDARATFVRLRELFEEMRQEKMGGEDFRHLSMGTSQDYAVAVEEGATMIRVGTALFAGE